jgi:hypothetical protein
MGISWSITVANKIHASISKVLREHKKRVPLAESLDVGHQVPKKIQEKMTAEDCCAILQGLAENDPERVISRNYFRCHSGIKESTWQQFYGSFQEFKAEAGVTVTRGQRKHLLDIAKHASADTYRTLNAERRSYGTKYQKPTKGRWKTLLAFSDLHDVECDSFALHVLIDTAARLRGIIDTVCINGDLFDLPEFGRWQQDPREWNAAGRIKFVHDKLLKPLRNVLPDAQIDLIEGNHEYRLLRHLADSSPSLKSILSDLHGMSVESLFGLKEFEISYVAAGDLAAGSWRKSDINKELARNWKVYYDCLLAHHFPEGRKKGLPGFNGHHHKYEARSYDSPVYGPYNWVQLGCMCKREASYTDAEKWNQGFALVHVDTNTKATQFEYVPIGETFALAAGRFYER